MGHHRRTTYSFYQPRCALASWYTAVAKHLEEGILPYVPQPTASDYHHSSAEQPSLPLSFTMRPKSFQKGQNFIFEFLCYLWYIFYKLAIFHLMNNFEISCQITGVKKFEYNFKRFLKLMCAPLSLDISLPDWNSWSKKDPLSVATKLRGNGGGRRTLIEIIH